MTKFALPVYEEVWHYFHFAFWLMRKQVQKCFLRDCKEYAKKKNLIKTPAQNFEPEPPWVEEWKKGGKVQIFHAKSLLIWNEQNQSEAQVRLVLFWWLKFHCEFRDAPSVQKTAHYEVQNSVFPLPHRSFNRGVFHLQRRAFQRG